MKTFKYTLIALVLSTTFIACEAEDVTLQDEVEEATNLPTQTPVGTNLPTQTPVGTNLPTQTPVG